MRPQNSSLFWNQASDVALPFLPVETCPWFPYSDKSWIVRAAALDATAQRNDPQLIVRMMRSLADDKQEVQYIAAAAIYRLSKTQVSSGI